MDGFARMSFEHEIGQNRRVRRFLYPRIDKGAKQKTTRMKGFRRTNRAHNEAKLSPNRAPDRHYQAAIVRSEQPGIGSSPAARTKRALGRKGLIFSPGFRDAPSGNQEAPGQQPAAVF